MEPKAKNKTDKDAWSNARESRGDLVFIGDFSRRREDGPSCFERRSARGPILRLRSIFFCKHRKPVTCAHRGRFLISGLLADTSAQEIRPAHRSVLAYPTAQPTLDHLPRARELWGALTRQRVAMG